MISNCLSVLKCKVIMLCVLSICFAPIANGWTVTTTTAVLPKTGDPVSSQGGKIATTFAIACSTFTSTSVKYELYETSANSSVSSVKWLSNLSITYWTSNSGKVGEITKSSSAISLDKSAEQINFKVSGELDENRTTQLRQFGVKLVFSNSVSVPIWFIYTQYPGFSQVEVTLLPNGGSEPKPYSTYKYNNGGWSWPSINFSSGYKQTTMSLPGGAVGTEQIVSYANSFVMPSTTREGYVFDAWYTVSSYPEDNNVRIDETTKPSAKVKTISAHWLLAPVENIKATQDRADMVYLSWDPSSTDVSCYAIYRSEVDQKPPDCVARVTTCFFEDETAKAGRTYYYWVDAIDGSTAPAVGSSVVGSRTSGSVKAAGTVVVTNVVVHYILNSIQPEFAVQPSGDMNFVNIITEVRGGNVAVPETWTANYPDFVSKFGNDFTAALMKPTGKIGLGGTPMLVWQDYVAGTDPTKKDDVFTASIAMVDGKVVISYSPELDDERKALRKYTTWGKKSLFDTDWTKIEEGREADFNFFKVSVEMK